MKADTAAANYLVNGTAINISIIDTGIFNHNEFQNPSRIIAQKCYCTGCCVGGADTANTANDDNGHGTHVAGIAAGQGGGSNGNGVATNASLFAVKVCGAGGSCETDDIIKGIEWSVQNGANIISMSLGGAVSSDCYEDGVGDWVDNLTAQGVLFIIAAGNCGPGSTEPSNICPTKGSQTIDSPGCSKSALTIGATIKADSIATYSSLGATLDNRTKPDVVATGSSITSTYNNGGYASASGTSMATPFVSGGAALIMQNYRAYYGSLPDPSLVKAIIMNAVNTTGMNADAGAYTQRNSIYGSGRVDVNESLRIINFTANSSISNSQMLIHFINVTGNALRVTLYWPENRTARNNLDLVVGNASANYSWSLDANDTVEQVFVGNTSNGTWRAYVMGTSVTGSQRYFLASSMALVNDTTPPFWYDNRTITATVYNASNLSYFNISWDDNGILSSALIEGNWSGSARNYSMMHYGNGGYSYNATLPDGTFYWRSWANDTAGNTNVTDNWTFSVLNIGPDITDASVFPAAVLPGDNITVFANASDYSLDRVWFNVSNSSGFGAVTFMQNVGVRFNGTYNTSSLAIGTYVINISANDTRGNVTNLSSLVLNVTVPRNITAYFLDYSASPTNASVTIFYNGTSTARNSADNATNFTNILPEGLWDIRISSVFNVTLYSLNVAGNATGNVTIDSVPNANASVAGFVPVEVVAINTTFSFANAMVVIPNSSIATSLNISVLACHSWNTSNRSCGGAWENATANSSFSAGLATINTMTFSAFAVMRNTTCGDGLVDSGETASTCCQDTGCPSGQSCGSSGACYTPPSGVSGGGGGGGWTPPKRKSLILTAPAAISMLKNSSQTLAARLLNNGEVGLTNVSLSFSSSCAGCTLHYSRELFSLGVNESRDVAATISSGNAGSYGIVMTASSAQGAGNSTSATLAVLECEPGSTRCDGTELLSCSSDGMTLNRTACDDGCVNGACASRPLRILNRTSETGEGMPQNNYFMAGSVIVILFLVAVIIYMARRQPRVVARKIRRRR
ncbi:MAG: hypothetical protein FJY76_02215 [Candidatus Aenigmarchaeota archaeon]|nr:hypothetical protein [Candidatus Aenigmarchaeota archaeon]